MEITIAHVVGLLAAISIFWGGIYIGVYWDGSKTERLKYEAVKNGFACWLVDNNGNTKFTWNSINEVSKSFEKRSVHNLLTPE